MARTLGCGSPYKYLYYNNSCVKIAQRIEKSKIRILIFRIRRTETPLFSDIFPSEELFARVKN